MAVEHGSGRRKGALILAPLLSIAAPALLRSAATTVLANLDQASLRGAPGQLLGQEQPPSSGDDADSAELPPEQVTKYINVYKAMQRDRSLTVEQAATRQGLSLQAFRAIESKVERNDLVRERVRRALRQSPQPSPSPAAGAPQKIP